VSYVEPSKAFAHLDILAAWKRGEKPAPVTVEWDLSNRCTLGCQSCHFAHTHTKGPWAVRDRRLPMAFDAGGDLLDIALAERGLSEMAAAGVQAVVWSGGGEPTTHPHWPQIVSHAKACGLQQGMYTLGGLLSPKSAEHLADNLSWVVVSLDCVNAEAYAAEKGVKADRFEAACNGARWLAASPYDCAVGVSFLLHAKNWMHAADMLELGRSLGATYVMFRPTIETHPDQPAIPVADRGWIDAALPLLDTLSLEPDVECDPVRFAEYRDWARRGYTTCHGIKLNATITPDGRVWVCPQRRGMPESCVGDLRVESFQDVWARHPGQWTDFSSCLVMCRLHLLNEQVAPVFASYAHEAFL
jgi:MoaA/NifB/PqqE/SkfB family radical SAM enzyme